MNAQSFLLALAAFFTQYPERFTVGFDARDAGNQPVDVLAPDAFSFSVKGFFERSQAESLVTEAERAAAWERLCSVCRVEFTHPFPEQVNNHQGREAIVMLARKAAK